MKFHPDGPEIPEKLRDAQEDGELVIFCGAGISCQAGLPGFRGLYEAVCRDPSIGRQPAQRPPVDSPWIDPLDVYFEQLSIDFPWSDLQGAIARALTPASGADTSSHEHVRALATHRKFGLRLVTTNFDRLLEAGAKPETYVAPLLPVPKPEKWNGIVYLHGRLGDSNAEPGSDLIIRSSDFGRAYLVERWASRFVSELFRHYSALFVGYSLSDPILRYLLDALAAERRSMPDKLKPAYAIVNALAGDSSEGAGKLRSAGVELLRYAAARECHEPLHETLRIWADQWNGGLRGRLSIVHMLAGREENDPRPDVRPGSLTIEIDWMRWALKDPACARAFANLRHPASLEWLAPLETLLNGETSANAAAVEPVPLADRNGNCQRTVPISAVQHALACWLVRHLDKPDLLRWVLQRGALVHRSFADLINRRLNTSEVAAAIPAEFVPVWRAISGGAEIYAGGRHDDSVVNYLSRVEQEQWGAALQAGLIEALTPVLKLDPAPRASGASDAGRPVRLSDVCWSNCALRAGTMAAHVLAGVEKRRDVDDVRASLALAAFELLRSALRLQASVGAANENADLADYVAIKVGSPLEGVDRDGWKFLIELQWKSFEALEDRDLSAAQALAQLWLREPYPIFRRLFLWAAADPNVSPPEETLRLIVGDPDRFLWSLSTWGELTTLLPALWTNLPSDELKKALTELIVNGPNRARWLPHVEAESDRERYRDQFIAERLACLTEDRGKLPPLAESTLSEILARHEGWNFEHLRGRVEQPVPQFAVHGEPRWRGESVLDMSANELARRAKSNAFEDHLAIREIHAAANREPERALKRMRDLLAEAEVPSEVLRELLTGVGGLADSPELQRELLGLMLELPEGVLRDELSALCAVLWHGSANLKEENRAAYLDAWDRLLGLALEHPLFDMKDRATSAMNHPAGRLVEALFLTIPAPLKVGVPPPAVVLERLELALSSEGAKFSALVMVASRAVLLFDLCPEWTSVHLIPAFDWAHRERALAAWIGLLLDPRLRPVLFDQLKPSFLQCFEHWSDFDERERRVLPQLLASVCIDGGDALSRSEARECLRKSRAEGLVQAAFWIHQRLSAASAEGTGDDLWRDKVGPWLKATWPRERALRSDDGSLRLAWAAVETKDSFEEAAKLVASLIGPSTRAHFVAKEMSEHELVNHFPGACLRLVHKLQTTDLSPGNPWLRSLLDAIVARERSLRNSSEFQELDAIAVRAGT